MTRIGEMNEDDVLRAVRGSMERTAGQSRPPLETIMARGRAGGAAGWPGCAWPAPPPPRRRWPWAWAWA